MRINHDFDPGWTGMSKECNALVLREGYGDTCNAPKEAHDE